MVLKILTTRTPNCLILLYICLEQIPVRQNNHVSTQGCISTGQATKPALSSKNSSNLAQALLDPDMTVTEPKKAYEHTIHPFIKQELTLYSLCL